MTDRTEVMFEVLGDKLDKLIDVIKPLQLDVRELKEKAAKIDVIEQDIKIIKAAVTDTSRQVNAYEQRITHLESV